MDWRKATSTDNNISAPYNWLHLHYYEALNALFRIENALRVFVYIVLKNARKAKWADLQLSADEGGDTTINAIAKRRRAQDERFGYLGYRITSPLMHLTTGELIRLIFADPYWPMFGEFFPASRDIAKTKLEEIGNIRNALAHFRPIKADDVEVVKQNANQVLTGIELAISNVLRTQSIVPSNTADAWYSSLKQVAGQYCTVALRQSENERWIQARLIYTPPLLGKPEFYNDYRSWRTLTLQSPNVLRHAPAVLENVIFAAEGVGHFDPEDDAPTFRKNLDFVFSRQALTESHSEIKASLDKVVAQITEETDLIREDNLARGVIVRVGNIGATKGEKYWLPNTNGFNSRPDDDAPAEYWGERPGTYVDFITDATSYPWMPADVSDDAVPF